MNWKTVLLWAVGLLIVLLLASAAALKIFVSPDRIAALVIPRLQETFGREVAVGDAALSYFPHFGVSLRQLEIKNQSPFDNLPLARIETINAELSLFSIFSAQPRISRLVVSGWECLLVVDSLGRRNFEFPPDDSLEMGSDPVRPPSGEPLCREFKLERGRLLFRNDSTDIRFVFGNIGLDYSLGGGERADVTGKVSVDSLFLWTQSGDHLIFPDAFEAQWQGVYSAPDDSLHLRACSWRLESIVGRLDGALSRLSSGPLLALRILSERTVLSEVASSKLYSSLPMPAALIPDGQLRVEVSFSTLDPLSPSLRGKVTVTDFTLKRPGEATLAGAKLLEAHFHERTLSIYSEGGNVGTSPALLRLTVENYDDPTYSGEIAVTTDAATLASLLGLSREADLTGEVDISLSGFVRPSDLEAGRIFGSLLLDNIAWRDTIKSRAIDTLTLECQFSGSTIDVSRGELVIGDNKGQVTGRITDLPLAFAVQKPSLRRPKLDCILESDYFNFDTLIVFNGDVSASGDTGRVMRFLDKVLSLDASVRARIASGQFDAVTFRDFLAHLNVTNRILYSDSAAVGALGGTLTGELVIDFTDLLNPDLEAELSLRDLQSEELLSLWTNFPAQLSGRISGSLQLKGKGLDASGLRPSLTGRGAMVMKTARLVGFQLVRDFEDAIGIVGLERGEVRDLSTEFLVANQSLRFNRLTFKSGSIDYQVEGLVGFDADLALDVSRSLSAEDVRILSSLPEVRRSTVRNPRVAVFRITGKDENRTILIDRLR